MNRRNQVLYINGNKKVSIYEMFFPKKFDYDKKGKKKEGETDSPKDAKEENRT